LSRAVVFWLLALFAASAFAAQRLSVEQLNHLIAASRGRQDAKVAERLCDAELTERLSAANLTAFEAALPGPESRTALVALADQAEFLDPPPADILSQPAPSLDQQHAMIAKSIEYVGGILHRLPNFFAQQDTIRYQDSPPTIRDPKSGDLSAYQALHPVSRSVATVLYRDGQEIVQDQAAETGDATATTGLITSGEFGPIFSVLYGDLPSGNLRWAYWQQEAGLRAVFRFNVPKAASHYQVKFCCVAGRLFQEFSAYHGELTVDPADGTILRVTLIADLEKRAEITEAELMVEYGPVVLGEQKYLCPLRSVSVVHAPMQTQPMLPQQYAQTAYGRLGTGMISGEPGGDAPLQAMLNETTFDNYHLFRADAQILTADNAKGELAPTAPPKGSPESVASAAPAPSEKVSVANENALPAPSAASTGAIADASHPVVEVKSAPSAPANSQPTAQSDASTSVSSAPEMAVVAPAPFPEKTGPLPAASSFALSVNVRLVDVDVTAFDQKGQPVTGLTMKDFEVYDNGRKEKLNSFKYVGTSPAAPQTPVTSVLPVLYSNRLDATGPSQPSADSALGSSTILLLDPTNLSFADLSHAREQILKFLDRVPPSEPVGLYVRTGSSFNILNEETTNHAALVSALGKWIPSAQDLARAQEVEVRNRQQFDTVDSSSDMQYVNGNNGGMASLTPPSATPWSMDIPGGGTSSSVDPKMMKEGSDPARESMAALVAIAAHMNSIPGHKDLVWVASDNALANWTDQVAGNDKGPNTIGRFAIPTQEALNDAHVSLYPLDASQLETAATDASLQNNSVQLNPAIQGLDANADREAYEASVTDGRASAQMRQDLHAVQPAIQQLAQATGGRSFPRADNIVGDLSSVIEDGHASYLLSFSPDIQPDNQYHRLTVTVPSRRGIVLRYRAGYLYTKEPSSLKDRLTQAVWQPQDETEIGLNAHWDHASEGVAVSLEIAATDIGLVQEGDLWKDKLDIFLVQRDETGTRAQAKEQTLALNMKPATYQKILQDGIPFAEYIDHKQNFGTTRIIVVDENSGRMGSVTLPAAAQGNP
jgi:VWFA-related protein